MKLLDDILSGEQSHTLAGHLCDEEIRHIEAMITCEKGGQPAPPGKKWLYEVRFIAFQGPSSAQRFTHLEIRPLK